MRKHWITVTTIGLAALGGLAFVQAQGGQAEGAAAEIPPGQVQPIQFPHDVHAGTYQMDCQYCHFSAERSVDAGIPPVESCMGCHRIVAGATEQQQAEIGKLRDYYNRGEAIPWVRIYKVSDHVHFPHMRHLAAGLECQECHGEVQEMGVIVERDPVWGGDNMGWCISCHVQEEASRDCTVCHY
jgi:hypothetical protein